MATIISTKNVKANLIATVNGTELPQHTVRGWSTTAAGLVLADQDVFAGDIVRGLDGGGIGYLPAQQEGVITFTLLSISPSIKWFQTRYAEMRNNNQVVIDGSLINGVTRAVVNMTGGLLSSIKQFPDLATTGGGDVAYTITFDNVTGSYADFNDRLLTTSGDE